MAIKVEVKAGNEQYTTHSTHETWQDAVDQADMVHGRIVVDDVESLQFVEWSNGDDTYGGVSYHEYFDANGIYLGADDDGVEPVFA